MEDGQVARLAHRILPRGVGLVAGLFALALSAGLALADGGGTDPLYPGSVLNVSVTGPPVVGSEAMITATGTNAPQEPFGTPYGQYDLELFAVNHTLLPIPCAQSFNTEETIYENNDRAVNFLTFGGLNEGQSGPFTIQLPVPLTAAGDWVVCAYTVFITDDAAWASTEVTITPSSGKGTAGKPALIRRPRVTRSGGRLRCSPGSWSPRPSSYAYRWLVHNTGTAGRGSMLQLTRALRGHSVECSVTAKNAAGSTTATSLPVRIL